MRKDWLAWHLPALIAIGVPVLAFLALAGTHAVIQHRWLAFTLLIVFEALVLISAQVRAVRVRKRYLRHIHARHRHLEGPSDLPLEQAYVQLRLTPLSQGAMSSDPTRVLSATLPPGGTAVWAYLWPGPAERQGLTVIGPPGSGKTTLLKHVALILAGERRARRQVHAPEVMPVLLSLCDAVTAFAKTSAISAPSLAQLVQADLAGPSSSVSHAWLEEQLRRGHCLVMLDGLDQVVEPEPHERAARWVKLQMARYPRCRFLIASRTLHDWRGPLRQTVGLEIRPLASEQIEALVSRWCAARQSTGDQPPNPPRVRGIQRDWTQAVCDRTGDLRPSDAAACSVADLLQQIRRDPATSALATSPLLLTLYAIVHQRGRPLPARRVEIFAAACDLFLESQATSGSAQTARAQTAHVLQALAYHMMQRRRCDLSSDEVARAIPIGLADAMRASRGLLVQRANGTYCFAHSGFQAYLAAAYAKRTARATELIERVNDAWWHETIRLYAGQTDATPIIQACLAQSLPSASPGSAQAEALRLAADCIHEAQSLAAEARAGFEDTLREIVERADPERSHGAADALLSLRLDQLIRLDEERYADNGLITHAEYQIFLDERRQQGQYHQPDHWLSFRFPAGQGSVPVLGVRLSDAAAFCDWLTVREPGAWHYRLPRAGELPQHRLPGGLQSDVGGWAGGSLPALQAGYWVRSSTGLQSDVGDGAGGSLPALQAGYTARIDAAPGSAPADPGTSSPPDQHVALTLARDLARAHSRERDLDRARTLALSRASDLMSMPVRMSITAGDMDHILTRVRASDATLSQAHDEVLSWMIDRIIAFARGRVPPMGLDLSPALLLADLGEQLCSHELASDIASIADRSRGRTLDRAIERILNSIVAFDLSRSRASAGKLSRASNQARDVVLTLDLARRRAEDFADIRPGGPHPARSLAHHLESEIARASDLAHGLARDLASRVDRALGQVVECARASDLARTIDLPTAMDRARTLSLARAVDLASAGAFDVARDLINSLALDLDLAHARAHELVSSLSHPERTADLLDALHLARTAVQDLALAFDLVGDLDRDTIIVRKLVRAGDQMPMTSSEHDEIARSWRWHVRLQTLALAVRLDGWRAASTPHRQHIRPLSSHQPPRQEMRPLSDARLELYVDMAILEGRIQGDLAAYEGIRIMHQRTLTSE